MLPANGKQESSHISARLRGKHGILLLPLVMLVLTLVVLPSANAHNIPEELQPNFLESVIKTAKGDADMDITGIYAIEEYWHSQKIEPAGYGLDPEHKHVFLLIFTTHVGILPFDAWDWYNIAKLQVGEVLYAPESFKILQPDIHHLVMALQFPKTDAAGNAVISEHIGNMSLVLENLTGRDDKSVITWSLPVSVPEVHSQDGNLLGTFPVLLGVFAGLAIYLSPCFFEMCGINVALLAGVSGHARTSQSSTRKRALLTSALFVAGFTSLYTSAGYIAGLGGQIVQDSVFDPISLPLRIGGGAFMIFLGLQSFGLTPRILNIYRSPTLLRASGNIDSTKFGGAFLVGLSLGCLQAFRASIVAVMLFYSWAVGSAFNGALMLLALSLSFGAPFIILGLFYDKMSFLPKVAPKISRHSPVMIGAFLFLLGVLMILNTQGLLSDFILPLIPAWVRAYV